MKFGKELKERIVDFFKSSLKSFMPNPAIHLLINWRSIFWAL